MLPPPDAVPRLPVIFVHVTKYRGETRDYWGEAVALSSNSTGQLTVLVHLFAAENELRDWRRFVVEEMEVES